MLPMSLHSVGGLTTLIEQLPASHLSFFNIGVGEIVNYFVTYTLGVMVGQDIWQRFFTGRRSVSQRPQECWWVCIAHFILL